MKCQCCEKRIKEYPCTQCYFDFDRRFEAVHGESRYQWLKDKNIKEKDGTKK